MDCIRWALKDANGFKRARFHSNLFAYGRKGVIFAIENYERTMAGKIRIDDQKDHAIDVIRYSCVELVPRFKRATTIQSYSRV